MMTDPISDLLTQVRNAIKARQPKVDVPTSQLKVGIVDLWKNEGFIKNYKLFRQGEKGVLRIYLKYVGKKPAIEGLKRLSKPSRRLYCRYQKMPKIRGGLGTAILSTSRGILTDKVAQENKVGGELLCAVW